MNQCSFSPGRQMPCWVANTKIRCSSPRPLPCKKTALRFSSVETVAATLEYPLFLGDSAFHPSLAFEIEFSFLCSWERVTVAALVIRFVIPLIVFADKYLQGGHQTWKAFEIWKKSAIAFYDLKAWTFSKKILVKTWDSWNEREPFALFMRYNSLLYILLLT